mgnify:FL=1|jgi:hypothetical protein
MVLLSVLEACARATIVLLGLLIVLSIVLIGLSGLLIVLSIVLIVLSGLLLELWRVDEGLRSCWEVLRSVKFELGVSVFG